MNTHADQADSSECHSITQTELHSTKLGCIWTLHHVLMFLVNDAPQLFTTRGLMSKEKVDRGHHTKLLQGTHCPHVLSYHVQMDGARGRLHVDCRSDDKHQQNTCDSHVVYIHEGLTSQSNDLR